jgi:hypothetical protein
VATPKSTQVVVELEQTRGTVETGFAEVKGSLTVLVERTDRTAAGGEGPGDRRAAGGGGAGQGPAVAVAVGGGGDRSGRAGCVAVRDRWKVTTTRVRRG